MSPAQGSSPSTLNCTSERFPKPITVTGETPVVDVQSARHQQVLDDRVVSEIPATRGYNAILAAIPSVTGGSSGCRPRADDADLHEPRWTWKRRARCRSDGLDVRAQPSTAAACPATSVDTTNAAGAPVARSRVDWARAANGRDQHERHRSQDRGQRVLGPGLRELEPARGRRATTSMRRRKPLGILNPPTLHNVVGRQWIARRADQARQALVLCDNAQLRLGPGRGGTLFERQHAATRTSGRLCRISDDHHSKCHAAGRSSPAACERRITPENKIGFYLDHQLNCDQSAYIQNAGNCRSARHRTGSRPADSSAVRSLRRRHSRHTPTPISRSGRRPGRRR